MDESFLIFIIKLALIVLALVIAGILVAAQKGIAMTNRGNIKTLAENGNKKAEKLVVFFDKSPRLLPTTLLLSVTVGFLVCLFVNEYVSLNIDMGNELLNNIIFIGVTLISAMLYLILVIYFPRQVAKQHAEEVALKLVSYANFMVVLLKPIIVFVGLLTNVLLRLTRHETGIYEETFSEDSVITMLEIGQESGALKEEGKKMINSIFDFDDKLAYEIMTPRTDVFAIDISEERSEYIDEFMQLKYSRVPVYDDDSDNIIGILNIKDFIIESRKTSINDVDIRKILRKPFFVPETKNIDSLFFELQKTKQHIAILIDEYGGFSGIVTMEDIIEEVMGDIDDEYDDEEAKIKQVAPNKYLLDGNIGIDDINDELNIELKSDTSETIGGFIIDILGEIPSDDVDENIHITYENYDFEIVQVKDRRIKEMYMTVHDRETYLKNILAKEEKQENTGE